MTVSFKFECKEFVLSNGAQTVILWCSKVLNSNLYYYPSYFFGCFVKTKLILFLTL